MTTIIKKITIGSPNRPLQIIASNADANVISGVVDSGYVNERIDAGQFLDSGEARVLIDSAYIQARQTLNQVDSDTIESIIDSAYINARISTHRDSSFVESVIDSAYIIARASTFDSSSAIGLIDSAYIQVRQDFSYSSLTDVPTLFSPVGIDSSATTTLIDSAYIQARQTLSTYGDSDVQILVDSAYVQARQTLSTYGDSDVQILVDSAYVQERGVKYIRDSGEVIRVTKSIIPDGTGIDLGSWPNKFRSLFIGGATLYIGNTSLSESDGQLVIKQLNPATGQPLPGQFNTITTDATSFDSNDVIGFVDSSYISTRTWTQSQIENFAKAVLLDSSEAITLLQPRIDSAVSALIDAAPDQLNTLNELAAALNDDSDAFNTLQSSINTKITSAETITLIDSAYVQARQAPGTDSSEVAAIAIETIDSNYISSKSNATTLTLGTPTDSSLTDGAVQTLTSSTKIVDAIDDLNEALENVRNDTFVKTVNFNAAPTAGGAGTSVTLSLTTVGNPNRYDIYWGDGNVDSDETDTTPTHTYSSNVGSPFTVKVVARNNSGSGTGSFAEIQKVDHIIIYTADPVSSYFAYSAPTGGSPITFWNDGDTVYFENNTTNIGSADVTYRWTWGDGTTDDVDSDAAAGGTSGARISHTFPNSTEQEVQRTTQLSLLTHETANPSVIPETTSDTFEIYDSHSPTFNISSTNGINEESVPGHAVTFTNTTETTIGSFSTYGIQYQWTFGDGSTQTVNVGSGADGDTSETIGHTYTLSSSDQANGNSQDYTGNLRVISNHTSSPFISSDFTVHIEPDVRANIAGTAVTTSDGSSDNSFTIYNHVDLLGNNRALVRATNTSQNADNYIYTWGDGDSDRVNEDGVWAGTISAPIDHDYTGEGTGNKVVNFTSEGTPDITAQTDTESITFVMKAVPSAPSGLSSNSLTLSTSTRGTSPLLASGFIDNSTSNSLSAGESLATSTARRYTSSTVTTNTIQNSYNGASGTLSVSINGTTDGSKTFSTSLNENGTFTSLIVSGQVDYNDINSSYPSNFYQIFDASVSKSLSGFSVGVNDIRLEHTETGNTNYVSFLKDYLTSSPTIENSGTLSENVSGTFRYISGIPYYNSGSPSLTLSGVEISDLVGQSYINSSEIVEVDPNTGSAISTNNYTYANIDGSSTMLSGGIPVVDTGVSSPYAIGNLTVPITSSSVRTIGTAKIRSRNVNGLSSYSTISSANIAVHTASQSGISEISIAVADALGSGFDDDGKRIFDFSAETTDTPTITGSTNFYTNNLYTEASDPGVEGTKEATVRLGVIQHDVTDYSSGFLPVGPDRSSDTGTQYFTFAFRRTLVNTFDVNITSSGIAGLWLAMPGETTSTLNGWVRSDVTFGATDGAANTNGDQIQPNTSLSGSYQMQFGTANSSNSTNNVILIRIALSSSQSVTALSISEV